MNTISQYWERYLYHSLLVVVILLTLVGCDSQYPATTLERPETVPVNAIWVGGMEGGVYVLLAKPADREKHIYTGTIFYENGEPWYRGEMALSPADASFTDIDREESYVGWDGETLYLSGERSLKALGKID